MRKSRSFVIRAVVACALLIVVGCGKVTQENYDKIESGMTVSQVESILGKGAEQSSIGGAIGELGGSAKIVTWGGENKSITITFINGQVATKAQKGL